MIPLWKIQREVMRIGAQIKNLPTAIVDLYELTQEPKLRRAHFAKLHERIALTDGQAPETDRVAILLIYQPAGLAESTIILCQDLINNGFSPFVVTNSPLSDTDSTKLEAWCWKLMTRPNFGYDFGGYQDALFALRKIKTDLDYLIVMNDSVWLEFTPDLWVRLSEIDADVVGLIQEDKILSTQTSDKHVDYRNIQSYF
jgi:lipopolysaccharide biosynthesis protein